MKTKNTNTKKQIFNYMLLVICALLAANLAIAISASLKTSTDTITSMLYTGSSGSVGNYYKDAQSPNSDVGLELCGAGQKYVGLAYAANVSGTMLSVLVSYGNDAPDGLENTADNGGGCWFTNPVGNFQISPSHLSTRIPEVFIAAFPGRPYVFYADSANGTVNPNYYPIPAVNGSLNGSYSISSLKDQFNEATKNITIPAPTISFETQSGSFTKAASDATFGASSDRKMVIAVCNSTQGQNCNSGQIVNDTADFSLSLYSGVGNPNEAQTFDRYVSINGYDLSICIGPDLTITSTTVNTTSVYSTQSVRITANYKNEGNVNITNDFNITFYFAGSVVNTTTITGTLEPLETGSVYYDLDTTGYSSGAKSTKSSVNYSGIADCGDYVDERNGPSVSINSVITPNVYINGVLSDTFPDAGRPYNVTVHLNDSDGTDRAGLTIRVTEENGLSIFTPVQTANQTGLEMTSFTGGSAVTNTSGYARFTLIPTGNKLYTPAYQYLNLSDRLGNYSVYFEVFTGSTELQIEKSGLLVDEWEFTLSNLTVRDPTGAEINSLNVINQDTYVKAILEYVNQAFAAAYSWLS